MSSESYTNTKTKSVENESGKTPIEPSPFENISQNGISSLECLMSYIGSKYPHFKTTVLPVAFTVSFLMFAQSNLKLLATPLFGKTATQERFLLFFRTGGFLDADYWMANENNTSTDYFYPEWDLSIVLNVFTLSLSSTMSPRNIALVSVLANCVSMVAACYTTKILHLNIFITQIFIGIFTTVSMCMIIESVPKYHRLAAVALYEIVDLIFKCWSLLIAQTFDDVKKNLQTNLILSSIISILVVYLTYFTFRDSLFNLLARSKFDKLQSEVARIFKKAKIAWPADAVVDSFAFDNFDDNENSFDVLIRSIKSFKIVQEVVVSGVITGSLVIISSFFYFDMSQKQRSYPYDARVLGMVPTFLCDLGLILVSFIIPNHRVFSMMVCNVILFICVIVTYFMPYLGTHLDKCTSAMVLDSEWIVPHYLVTIIGLTSLKMIQNINQLRLLEVMPTLIRIPTLAIFNGLAFSFEVNVRTLLLTQLLDGVTIIVMVSVISMLLLVLIPRNSIEMNVYFSEIITNQRCKKMPPAPIVEETK